MLSSQNKRRRFKRIHNWPTECVRLRECVCPLTLASWNVDATPTELPKWVTQQSRVVSMFGISTYFNYIVSTFRERFRQTGMRSRGWPVGFPTLVLSGRSLSDQSSSSFHYTRLNVFVLYGMRHIFFISTNCLCFFKNKRFDLPDDFIEPS